ncbi:MAG: 50S ribosomal protein L6 [bacterium]|nr:50S ribosomal protein L6 [bacterium]MDA1024557.1 50S ribosomal protein L6 [bacterium]
MSRIGNKPVFFEGAEAALNADMLTVKGSKGELTLTIPAEIKVEITETEEGKKVLNVARHETGSSAIWGTYRALIQNMVTGVTKGWTKVLELNGVGFKMALQGKTLVMSLGFSHEVRYELPASVDAVVEGMKLTLTSIDKQLIGQTAAEIRSLKKPEPYKGKGFKYDHEVIRRKAGKAAKGE